MTGRRITPTGVLVSTAAPKSDEWFAIRRDAITASDLPKILGYSSYGTALNVWAEKLGKVQPEEAGLPAEVGTELEDWVAQRWARLNGEKVRRVGVIQNIHHPWMRCSLDRIVVGKPEALECKTHSVYLAPEWKDDTPDDHLAQIAYQMACTGLRTIHLAALIGNGQWEQRTITWDDDLIAYVTEEARKVWQHIQDGTEPEVSPSQLTTRLYEKLWPDPAGDIEVDDYLTRQALNNYRWMGQSIKTLKSAQEDAKATLVMALRGKARGLIGGFPAYTFKASTKKSYTVAASTTHTFRLTKESA